MEEKNYSDGQPVFAEGDPGDSMFFILGSVRIEKKSSPAGTARKRSPSSSRGLLRRNGALGPTAPLGLCDGAGKARFSALKTAFDELQTGSDAGRSVLFAMIRTSRTASAA